MEIVKYRKYGCLRIWGESYLQRLQAAKEKKNIRNDLLLIAEGLQFLGIQQQIVVSRRIRALLVTMRDRKKREQNYG